MGKKAKPVLAKDRRQENAKNSDSRFASIQTSAIYRLPSRHQNRVALDSRFSSILDNERFASHAKVDRYGRRLPPKSQQKALNRLYRVERPGLTDRDRREVADDESVTGSEDNYPDAAATQKLKQSKGRPDIVLSEPSESSSSSEYSSSDESEEEVAEDDDDNEAIAAGAEEVPEGEISSRLAAVNLDWDHIQAADLLAVFSSFAPEGGQIRRVLIYPSDFGKERIAREDVEGPPREIFATSAQGDSRKSNTAEPGPSDSSDDETIKKSLIQEDDGQDFDSVKLRNYQLERLRYFYAVIECSSAECAKGIYDLVDGTEYLSSANFFDLRFIPEEMDFSLDSPREICESLPDRYRPNDFVTDALQHSKVKLSWDADDPRRAEAQKRAFSGNQLDEDDQNLQDFIASSSSEDEQAEKQGEEVPPSSKSKSGREKDTSRIRALLGLGNEESKRSAKAPILGDMEVTFTSGLSEPTAGEDTARESSAPETTIEKYARKERERKSLRKKAIKANIAAMEGQDASRSRNLEPLGTKEQDLGFDDPFFADPSHKERESSKSRKRSQRRGSEKEHGNELVGVADQSAELELLLADGSTGRDQMAHFDKRQLKIESQTARGSKRKARQSSRRAENQEQSSDSFKMSVGDPRFKAIYEKSEFAVDPNHPRFDKTEGMMAVLEESRRKRLRTDETD